MLVLVDRSESLHEYDGVDRLLLDLEKKQSSNILSILTKKTITFPRITVSIRIGFWEKIYQF